MTASWTPAEDDVERAAEADWEAIRATGADVPPWSQAQPWDRHASRVGIRAALATVGPLVERERKAAAVEDLRQASAEFRLRHEDSPDCGFEHAARVLDARADEIEASS